MKTDSKGNIYKEVNNLRISYIKSSNRKPNKDWPGSDVIRIQAYRDGVSASLHMGAEIPISNSGSVLDLIETFVDLYKTGTKSP